MTIYVVRAIDTCRVKIGCTKDVDARLAELQTGCPFRLELICTMDGMHRTEGYIHEILKGYRVQGEWFSFAGPVRRLVDEIRTHGDVSVACAAAEKWVTENTLSPKSKDEICHLIRQAKHTRQREMDAQHAYVDPIVHVLAGILIRPEFENAKVRELERTLRSELGLSVRMAKRTLSAAKKYVGPPYVRMAPAGEIA
jgi:hypothetical protein